MNKYLLDTCVLLWIAEPSPRLKPYKQILLNLENKVYFTPVNLLEIGMLNRLGRLKEKRNPSAYHKSALESGYFESSLAPEVFDVYQDLPLHHRDPYDRLIIAQAIHYKLTILTADPWFKKYDAEVFIA